MPHQEQHRVTSRAKRSSTEILEGYLRREARAEQAAPDSDPAPLTGQLPVLDWETLPAAPPKQDRLQSDRNRTFISIGPETGNPATLRTRAASIIAVLRKRLHQGSEWLKERLSNGLGDESELLLKETRRLLNLQHLDELLQPKLDPKFSWRGAGRSMLAGALAAVSPWIENKETLAVAAGLALSSATLAVAGAGTGATVLGAVTAFYASLCTTQFAFQMVRAKTPQQSQLAFKWLGKAVLLGAAASVSGQLIFGTVGCALVLASLSARYVTMLLGALGNRDDL